MHKVTILNNQDKVTIEGKSRRDLYAKIVSYLLLLDKNSDNLIRKTVKVYNEPKFYKDSKDSIEINENFHLYANYSVLEIDKRISKLIKAFNLQLLDEDVDESNYPNNAETSPESENQSDIGCVYLLENKYMPGVYKIGISTVNRLHSRVRELYTTSVPIEFSIIHTVETEDAYAVEQAIHSIMEERRINPKREFFQLSDVELRMVKKSWNI